MDTQNPSPQLLEFSVKPIIEQGVIVIPLPQNSAQIFGTIDQIDVEGKINGQDFGCIAFSDGDGGHHLLIGIRFKDVLRLNAQTEEILVSIAPRQKKAKSKKKPG